MKTVNEMIAEYIERGGRITHIKPRVSKYKSRRYMPVTSKKLTYGRNFDGPTGYHSVNYEQVGNNASGYSTKYVMGKELN